MKNENINNLVLKMKWKLKRKFFRSKIGEAYLEKLGRTNLSKKYQILSEIRTPEETRAMNEMFRKINEFFDSPEFDKQIEAYVSELTSSDELTKNIKKEQEE